MIDLAIHCILLNSCIYPSFEFLGVKYAVNFPTTNSIRFSYSLEQIFMLDSNTMAKKVNILFLQEAWLVLKLIIFKQLIMLGFHFTLFVIYSDSS